MKAMVLERTGAMTEGGQPLRLVDLPVPEPDADEILVRVHACGVCHTELDEIEGRLMPPRLPIIPGHQVVGRVEQCGASVTEWTEGDRVGIGWIYRSSGGELENLSPQFTATGCDVDGGYAEYMTAPAQYAVAIPESYSDHHAAPLLCAGAIGYRALRLTELCDGDPLGLMGFGGSAHLVLQTSRRLFPGSPIYVFAREETTRQFALQLGADWAGDVAERPPDRCGAIIDTTPAWRPVVEAMKKLRPGGRLVVNAIRKEAGDQSALMDLNYHEHLWMEREIKSVANIAFRDLAEFVPLAAQIPIEPAVTCYSLREANEALWRLKSGALQGANVLRIC